MASKGSRARAARRAQDIRSMKPEARVKLAVEMSDTAMAVTLDSIRDRNPGISTAKLMELARKRFQSGRRTR